MGVKPRRKLCTLHVVKNTGLFRPIFDPNMETTQHFLKCNCLSFRNWETLKNWNTTLKKLPWQWLSFLHHSGPSCSQKLGNMRNCDVILIKKCIKLYAPILPEAM